MPALSACDQTTGQGNQALASSPIPHPSPCEYIKIAYLHHQYRLLSAIDPRRGKHQRSSVPTTHPSADAIESVDFTDNLALSHAAKGGVARHDACRWRTHMRIKEGQG